MIFKQRILLFLVVSFFISYSSVAYAVDYGSGLYGSDSYSVTTQEKKSSSSTGFYNKQQLVNISTVTPTINTTENIPDIEIHDKNQVEDKNIEDKKIEDDKSENKNSIDNNLTSKMESPDENISIDRSNFWGNNKLLLLINILFLAIILFWFFTNKRKN